MFNKNKRGQLNISFGWIFAIVVGAFILFLAIYGVSKFMNIQETQQSAESSVSISNLLNSLETGFETGQKATISTGVDTRIITQCENQGLFGRQKIRTQQKTFDTYTSDENSIEVTTRNKYLFLDDNIEGKIFFAFSKPYEFPSEKSYEFPFKIADLIYLTSSDDNYCFRNAPSDIEEEITNINQDNFYTENCPQDSTDVCFNLGASSCDVEVSTNSGTIQKDSDTIYFEGDSLMYAGIFSSKEEYECQINRLMKRAKQLTVIYQEKASIEKSQGCDSEMEISLYDFGILLDSFENSGQIFEISEAARELNSLNSNKGDCKLW